MTRKLAVPVFILLLGVLASCTHTPLIPVTSPITRIRVAMDNNYPPYIFLDEQGNPRGILVDQWALWEQKTGVEVELSAIHWEDALNGMKNGEYDVIDTIFRTGEREKTYDFTDAYARIDVPIFFHRNISGISSVEDLKGFRVAVKSGDADAEFLEKAGVTSLVYYDSYEEIVQAATKGEENIFVVDQPPGLHLLYKYGLQNEFNRSAPLFSGEFHRAVKKGNAALLSLVEGGFASISESEYQAIDRRWLGVQQTNIWQEYLPYLQAGILIALLVIGTLVIFARALQRRVDQRTRELKQALSDLQKSERRYREIFNATTEAIFVHEPDGRLLHVNEPMLQMYGYDSEEEVFSMRFNELGINQPPYSGDYAKQKIRLALEEGPQVFEWLAKRKNGEVFWTEVSLRVTQIGGEGQILAVVRDISGRKRAEEALFESEARYRRLVSNASDIIFRYDIYPEMKLTYVNPAVEIITGYTPEECYADPLLMLNMIHPDDINLMSGYVQSLTPPDGPLFARWIGKDGVTRWMESLIAPVRNVGGQLIAVEGITRDITARKQAEDALRESENMLKEAQKIANMGSYVLNFSTGMWKSSAVLDRIFGIDDSYIRSVEGWENLIHPDYRQWMIDYFTDEVIGRHIPFDREYKIVRQNDKAERWVHGYGVLAFDRQDNLLDMRGMIQDITERKQAEEALRESEELYRKMNENSPLGMHFYRLEEGRLIFTGANPAADMLLKVDNSQFIGKSIEEAFPPLIQSEVPQRYRDAAEKGIPWSTEQITYEDGHIRGAFEVRAFQTTPGNMVAVFADITARKQAEQSLQDSHDRLLVVLDSLEADIYVADLNTYEVLFMNRHMRESFGGNLVGRVCWQAFRGGTQRCPHCTNDNLVDADGNPTGVYVWEGQNPVTLQWYTNYDRAIRWIDGRLVRLQIATDITVHKQAEDEVRRRVMELETLYESGLVINQLLDPKEIGQKVIELLKERLNWHHTTIRLYHPHDESLELLAFNQPGLKDEMERREVEDRFQRLVSHSSQGVSGWAVRHRQVVRSNDLPNDPRYVDTYPGLRSGLYVPMLIGERVVGVISIESEHPDAFTAADERLTATLANQAASALENARLFEQTERRLREFTALYETSNVLSGGSELNSMLQIMVERTRELLDAKSSGIYMYLAESDELVLTVDVTPYSIIGTRLKSGEGAAGHVAKTRLPLRLDDYSTWEKRSLQYEGTLFRAILGVPMLYGGELIGVLMVGETGDSTRRFTEDDVRLLSLFASQAAGAVHSARLREQTERRLKQLQALHTIDRAISSSFDLRPILNTVIAQTIAQLNVDAVDVLLYHPYLQRLDYVAGRGFRTRAIEQTRLRLGECFSGRAAFERRTIHVPNLPEVGLGFTRAAMLSTEDFLEMYAVPLIAKGEVKGVLEVFHRAPVSANPEWLDFLETLAKQAAITIDQTQLFDSLQRANLELVIAYDATIEGWARAMDLRDRETESHTERVTELTVSLARAMGVRENEILNIRRGALLHDIGKMGIPDNILLKEGKLTDEEWTIMRRHPQFAYEMLQPIKYLRQSFDIPYCHHEKWDGTGYPRGLRGEQIPLAARIFAIADVWDALTSDRPYRKAWTNEEALSYIKEQSGKQFDPKVVEAFWAMMEHE